MHGGAPALGGVVKMDGGAPGLGGVVVVLGGVVVVLGGVEVASPLSTLPLCPDEGEEQSPPPSALPRDCPPPPPSCPSRPRPPLPPRVAGEEERAPRPRFVPSFPLPMLAAG